METLFQVLKIIQTQKSWRMLAFKVKESIELWNLKSDLQKENEEEKQCTKIPPHSEQKNAIYFSK